MTRAVFSAILWVAAGVAQTERASIRGTIEDATGSVVPDAAITAVNIATGIRTSTVSTQAGNYNIPQLQPGTYRVETEKSGFKKLVRENIKLDVAAVIGLNIVLQVGETSQTVTVAEAVPQLQTEGPEVRTVINPKTYLELPLDLNGGQGGGRNSGAFVFLAPGVSGNSFTTTVNGSQVFSDELQLDGMTLQTFAHTLTRVQLSVNPDAVQEFSLATGSYSAEYGSTAGSVQRYTVRSGTNQIHGSLYEYLRNEKLDARGFFNATRSINKRNEFGGSVGGPVWLGRLYNGKDRTFFFVNRNHFKFRSGPSNALASVAPLAFRQGDFSELLTPANGNVQIFDPATTRLDGQGGFTRDPFVGNIIPQSRFSTVSKNVMTYLPNPIGPGIVNNFRGLGRSMTNKAELTVRLDHRLNSNHSVYGTLNRGDIFQGCGAVFLYPISGCMDQSPFVTHNPRIAHDWIIRPTIVNHVSVGINRELQAARNPSFGQNWGQKLGLGNVPNAAFPLVRMPSYTNISNVGGAGDQAVKYVHHTWAVTDGLSIVKGRHNFKTGMEYRWVAVYTTQNSSSGVFDFNRVQTAFPSSQGRATTGNPFASFLLGQVDRGELYIGDQPLRFRVPYFATYFQDDFRVRSNLTINMGLRWDIWGPMSERDGKYSIMDPSVPNPAAGGRPGGLIFAGSGPNRTGSSRLTSGVSKNNFGPRLGLAWTVRPRLVIRTGYGISFFPTTALGAGGNRNSSRGFDGLITRINQNQGLTATFNWDNGFPTDFVPPPFINAGFGVGSTINMWNDNAHEPSYRQDWSFGIQRDLGADWLVDLAYVGAKGTRLPTGVFNPNQVDPKYLSLGDLLLRPIGDPSVVAAGFRSPYQGFTGTLAQSLRRFPQYAYVGTVGVNGFDQSAPVGNSTYHSAQVKLEKRFSKGLFLLSSYTWSKNLTDSSSQWGGFFSTSARDHYNRSIDKALSLVDITHRWTNALTYELPIGPGKAVAANVPKAVAQVIGGWQFNGILTYQSGLPLATRVANTLPLFNDRNAPDVVSGVPQSLPRANFDPARDRLLNAAAFRVPAPFTYGNAPATLHVRELPLLNEDFGISKRFPVTERASIEFRFEMFNMFNRTRFAGVDQTRGNGELLTDVFSFGRVTRQVNAPRQTQFHLRFTF